MPKALQVDWKRMETLYSTGSKPSDLSAEFRVKVQTIYRRISRAKWRDNRTAARENVTNMIDRTIESKSAQARSLLGTELVSQAQAIKSIPILANNLGHLSQRAAVASTVAKASETVFGWGDAPKQFLVNIAVLSSNEPQQISQSSPAKTGEMGE